MLFSEKTEAQNYATVNYKITVPANSSGGSTTDYTIDISLTPIGVYITAASSNGYNYNISFKLTTTITNYNGSANTFWNFNVGFYNSNSARNHKVNINSSVTLANGTKEYSLMTNINTYVSESNNYTAGQTYPILSELGYTFLNIDTYVAGHQTTINSDGTGGENGVTQTTSNNHSDPSIKAASYSLPIKLSSFGGQYENHSVFLKWTTETEINNKYFVIERSANGVQFDSLASVNGVGNSSVLTDYSYQDRTYLNGNNYYRLRQIDFDGKSSNSNIIKVSAAINTVSNNNIYPNPGNGNITISGDWSSFSNVSVSNMIGATVISKVLNSNQIQLPASLTPGMY
ncbi:MAG: hypothetical protein DI598_19530, partial [Pseudopedobacter saltans]